MGKFKCEVCNYETNDLSNFKKHNESIKHIMRTAPRKKRIIKNVSKDTIYCGVCGTEFKHKSSMYRHKKHFCVYNKMDKEHEKEKEKDKNVEDDINILKYELKIKDLENRLIKQELETVKSQGEQDKYKTVADIYKGENEFHKTLSINAGNMLGKTVNAITYIMENYNKAPELKLLDNETAMKLLKYETKDGKITNLITGKTPLQYLLDLHENGKLVSHLSNLIISQYKKIDPSDQSLWNTDSSRLTYVVRNVAVDKENNQKTKNLIWDSDKKGIKINNYIITPLLEQLRDMIMKYDKDMNNRFDDMTQSQRDKYADNSIHTIDIKQCISTSTLHKSILRYIAPYFHMSKCNLDK
jgi:hypothetical protein